MVMLCWDKTGQWLLGSSCYACGRQTWHESSKAACSFWPPPPPLPSTTFSSPRSFSPRRVVPSLASKIILWPLTSLNQTRFKADIAIMTQLAYLMCCNQAKGKMILKTGQPTYFVCCSRSQHLLSPSSPPPSAPPPRRNLQNIASLKLMFSFLSK